MRITSTNQGGVWREDAGGLALVARAGDHAPGTPAGVNYSFNTFTQSLAMNNQGKIAFWATLQGAATGYGIWSDGQGSLNLVARSGSQAPGTAPGTNFDLFSDSTIELNGAGQTAFWGRVTGPGVDATNNFGIWALDRAGILRLIVRTGGQIDVSNDPLVHDLRTVSALSFDLAGNTGNDDGRASSFNNLGQLTFTARFTDGSEGVFVSNLAMVPEPGWMPFVSVVIVVCAVRLRVRS